MSINREKEIKALAEIAFMADWELTIKGSRQVAISILDAGYLPASAVKSQWISVKERLPEKSCSVIVWGRYTKDCPRRANEARFDHKRKRFYQDCTITKDATHWMPLPEAPETETL